MLGLRCSLTTSLAALAQSIDEPTNLLQRLDPPTRAVVLMALLGLVLLGLGMVAMTMVGGRWVRRLAGRRVPKRRWPKRSEVEPAAPSEPRGQEGEASSDTLPGRQSRGDTVSE